MDEINQKFYVLFDYIITKIEQSKMGLKKEPKYNVLITEIENFIYNEYGNDNLTADKIAKKVGMSSEYLRRLFKKLMGESINDYISRYRINKAKEFLLNTSVPVSEIALITGFSNANYFYTVFKKINGITPSEFRNINTKI